MSTQAKARTVPQRATRVRRPQVNEVVVTAAATAEVAAEIAVKRSDWLLASQYYDKAADLQPPSPHPGPSSEEMRLRRQAHVTRTMHVRLKRLGLERAFIKRGRA